MPTRWSGRRALLAALAAAWVLAVAPVPVVAHDVPERSLVQVFVAHRGASVELLLRVPLILLLDEDLPRRGPGFLDLDRIGPPLRAAAERSAGHLGLFESGSRLAPLRITARVSRASDRSFESLATARRHVSGPPLDPATQVFWNQGFLDARVEYPVPSDSPRLALEAGWPPGLAGRVATSVRFAVDGGAEERAYLLTAGDGRVPLDPSVADAAWRFVRSGAGHVLGGADHLLFLVCLVLPVRRLRELILVATAFTLAHSITLIASVLGAAPAGPAFPALVETLIAASIVYAALENVLVPQPRYRVALAFGFGLVHGFGFAFALRESLQFAGAHLAVSLAAFNLGIEAAQVALLAVLAPAAAILLPRLGRERLAISVVSALVAHSAWHWTSDRLDLLQRTPWTAPGFADLAPLAQVLLVSLLVGGALARLAGRGRRQVSPPAST